MTELACVFFRIAPADIAAFKFVVESYEGLAVVRTLDAAAAVVVALVPWDLAETAQGLFDELESQGLVRRVPAPPGLGDDWLLRWLRSPSADCEPDGGTGGT